MSNGSFDHCDFVDGYSAIIGNAHFAAYHILTPIYFFAGLLGHGRLLVGFYRQRKTEPIYAYQIFLTVGETCEILAFSLYVVACRLCSSDDNRGEPPVVEWFATDRRLVWFAAHAAIPLVNVFITLSLILAVIMAADRMHALWKPASYSSSIRRRRRVAILIICILVAIASSIFDAFRFRVVNGAGGLYSREVDENFVRSPLAVALANVRNVLRSLALLALISSNVALVRLHRIRCGNKEILTSGSIKSRVQYRKRTLTALAAVQSISISCVIVPQVVFYGLAYARSNFTVCEGLLLGPIADSMLQLGELVSFYSILVLSDPLRRAIRSACKCRCDRVAAAGCKAATAGPSEAIERKYW